MKMGYTAFNLEPSARHILLNHYPAKFNKVVAHHVTYKFKVPENSEIPKINTIRVIGYSHNENIECVVVEVNGTSIRDDGKLFHITISHNANAKPFDSNTLLESGFTKIEPFELKVTPSFNPF